MKQLILIKNFIEFITKHIDIFFNNDIIPKILYIIGLDFDIGLFKKIKFLIINFCYNINTIFCIFIF